MAESQQPLAAWPWMSCVGTVPQQCETAALVTAMRAELARSLEELRELAQGIHPAALTDHGLPVALETVTTRCVIPCSLTVAIEGRLPAQVEVAIYYLVSEALANVAKHAARPALRLASHAPMDR